MVRQAVASSSIVSIGHDVTTEVLEVQFNNGGVYQYGGVSASDYGALLVAESKGRHINQFIKGRFPFLRVSP